VGLESVQLPSITAPEFLSAMSEAQEQKLAEVGACCQRVAKTWQPAGAPRAALTALPRPPRPQTRASATRTP
jgi:hypothetical protein